MQFFLTIAQKRDLSTHALSTTAHIVIISKGAKTTTTVGMELLTCTPKTLNLLNWKDQKSYTKHKL